MQRDVRPTGSIDPRATVLQGVRWGRADVLFTAAFWQSQALQHEVLGTYEPGRFGHTLKEEAAACLLGGYGMKAEVGLAAYERLRAIGLLKGHPHETAIEEALSLPLIINGRSRRYRFPRQKARYLSACLRMLDRVDEAASDVELRNHLATLPGIGLKTASWVTRNWRASDAVAVLDVHIIRAGQLINLFRHDANPAVQYSILERRFLDFASAITTRPSILDNLIWDYMRRLTPVIGPTFRI